MKAKNRCDVLCLKPDAFAVADRTGQKRVKRPTAKLLEQREQKDDDNEDEPIVKKSKQTSWVGAPDFVSPFLLSTTKCPKYEQKGVKLSQEEEERSHLGGSCFEDFEVVEIKCDASLKQLLCPLLNAY